MKRIKTFAVVLLAVLFAAATAAEAGISAEKARKIGEQNLKKLLDQSYHYRVEYDTVIVLPVHSKTVWKNDFYLLYFLKDDYFQVEMEVDAETEEPAILAMGKMTPPYLDMHTGTFNHRYFCLDSIMESTSIRQRMQQDSAQLVYFGVIPKLGKRGVVWEVFSAEGINYISLGGPNLSFEQLVRDLNTMQLRGGNFIADSIRTEEIMNELSRLSQLSDAEKRDLKMFPQVYDSLVNALKAERKEIIIKFPNLGRYFPLDD